MDAPNLVISWKFQHFEHVFLDRCSAQQSHLKLSKWVTFNWCYAFYLILKKGNDQKNRPKSTSPAFLLFHMANVEAKNLVISWNFQLFKHVFLSRCSTLQSRLKLSKWVTFNDFQTFSIFSEFQKRAEKIGRKPCPLYEGSKMKGNVRSCCPHMIEQTDRGEVFPRIWADFLKFMWFFSSFSESSFWWILMNFDEFFSLHYRRIFEFFLQERLKPNEIY